MNKRQRRTLQRIFEKPTRCDVKWNDTESLLRALDAAIRPGRGSKVRVIVGEQVLVVHRPHENELKKYAVESIRDFLENLGVKP